MARSLESIAVLEAIKIIEKPRRWCDGAEARTILGIPCSPYSPFVIRMCGEGAIKRAVYKMMNGDEFMAELIGERIINNSNGFADTNDNKGRAAVIAKMKEYAISV